MNSAQNELSSKHCYLIQTHSNTYTLEKTLKLIDDERNDIYIHVDEKCKNWDYDRYKACVRKSGLYFTDRINCNWAAYSQLEAMMILLKTASKNNYSYYHLLSGACMPLKSQDYIHENTWGGVLRLH